MSYVAADVAVLKACALQRQLGLVQEVLFVQLMQQLQLHQLLI